MDWFPFLCLCFQFIGASPPAISKVYRTDYVYNKKTDAFYKLHIDGTNYLRARELCSMEGTKLLIPENEWDLIQTHAMLKHYPDIDDLWVGEDGKPHEDIEENAEDMFEFGPHDNYDSNENVHEKCDILNKFGGIKSHFDPFCRIGWQHPFICKVEAKDANYDENCGVYGLGYEYNAAVGSCYRIPGVALTWNAAYDECRAVGAHLVVINSEAEHQAVTTVMHPAAPYLYNAPYFGAGFRAKHGTREFMTIFNQTLEEAGYAEWSDTEPNNYNNNEYCGSLFQHDGKLNDISCTDKYGFICEKEKSRT